MALSDECFEFLWRLKGATADCAKRDVVSKFVGEISIYFDAPFQYGDELKTLFDACIAFLEGQPNGNDDPLERIRFLAEAVRDYHDTPPGQHRLNS